MIEVFIKQQLAGCFSSGTDVAVNATVQSELPVNRTPPGDGIGLEEVSRAEDAEEIVMRKWNAEKGMSLVEATIILMVLAILTAVIAPSAGDYVNDARQTKAKEDVE